jgi:hypothetical protein
VPPSEVGGDGTALPPLPNSQQDKKIFESQVRAIWDRRQQLLVNLSRSAGDDDTSSNADGMLQLQLPKLLNRYILKLRNFVNQRYAACYGEEFKKHRHEITDFIDVLFILSELEYHLTDIDAARDFHTLGGWTVLGFLLSSPPWFWDSGCATNQQKHLRNTTSEDKSILINDVELENYRRERDQLQTAVSWVVGNAVKNHAEFAMWSLEPIPTNPLQLFGGNNTPSHPSSSEQLLLENDASSGNGHDINVISLLLDIIQQKCTMEEDLSNNLLPKSVYAISAILRGNPYAQMYFLKMGGGLILGNKLEAALFSNNHKLVKRVLSLAHDILVEISTQQQHENYGMGGQHPTTSILDEQEQKAVLRAFTGKQWCQSAFQMLEIQFYKQNHPSEVEAVLRIIEPMIPHCQDSFEIEGTKEIMQGLTSSWSSSEVDDEEWRQELLELADSIMNKLQYIV